MRSSMLLATRTPPASSSKFVSPMPQRVVSMRNVGSRLAAAASCTTTILPRMRSSTLGNCKLPGVKSLIQIPLLQNHVLSHDQPVRCHFLECREHATHVLIGIYEDDDDWQLASGIDQVASFDALPSQESPDGVQGAGGKNIFLMQIVQNGKVQRLAMPLV